jgi:hypothetical protein
MSKQRKPGKSSSFPRQRTSTAVSASDDDGIVGVIFLDIDGVLLPFPPPPSPPSSSSSSPNETNQRLFPDAPLAALSHMLESAVGAKIVLSSTWRVRPDFVRDILKCLEQYAVEHGGPLGDIANSGFWSNTDPNLHSERQWEIHEWLVQRQQQQEQPNKIEIKDMVWLALDDEELIEGETNQNHRHHFEGHVIKTASHVGLTTKDVDKAIELWKAQIQKL